MLKIIKRLNAREKIFMYNFRTDLALERNDIYKKQNNITSDIDGIKVENENKENIDISRIKILDERGEKALGKPVGNYITLDIKNMKTIDEEKIEQTSESLANEIRQMINEHISETAV